ncbi:MAG TPA: hypothetical protein VH650_13035 [Gaiellaceae bacterium]
MKILAAWLLAGALAVFAGQVWWDLTWSDTWNFALIAIGFMWLGMIGAMAQAAFLGTDDRDEKGRSAGERLNEKSPILFLAPWVMVSVLAAALVVDIRYLD